MTETISAADYRAGAKKTTKYRSKSKVVDGIKFDSQKEAKRYGQLMLLCKGSEIISLAYHVVYDLRVNGELICKYEADFTYYTLPDLKFVVEDVKSAITRKNPVYRLKKRLMKVIHGIEILET